MIIKLTGTGSGKADLRCDGWKGSRHIQFAIKDRGEKYLKSIEVFESQKDQKDKQTDGAKKPAKYEMVFAGGEYWNQVSGDDSSQIELNGTTLVLHLKKIIVQAIYYNLSNGLFIEIEDLEPGGPKVSGGIREDKNCPVTTTSGNGRIESSSGMGQFLGDDPEPDPAPEQNGAAAEGTAETENASQTGDSLQRALAEPVRPKWLTRQGPRETRPESRHLREMSLSQALLLRPELQELKRLIQPEQMLPLALTGPKLTLMAPALLTALPGALLWSSLQESTSPGRRSSSFL